ncbi:hypothetical protein AQUCO_01000393v1 [Aquilegia coerulea]|uniref:NAD(P)-binding domain-containing protein n=1 Tax=Aquilegia coerulea TaxID=218851 RepID=A0A2G5E9N3_AQUCA|nr:hypothetical protein AQUCO_01000393v1 [Aquilegia coerulea]
MELLLLPSSPLTTFHTSSSSRRNLVLKHHFLSDHTSLNFSNVNKYSVSKKLKFPHFRAQASESVQATTKSSSEEYGSKDKHLVFVAGSTGKVGSRTVRELLKLGFRVRAGVRSAQRAETLVQSVQQLKLDDGTSAVEKLELIECDLEQDRIEPAIANASVVICCIGASEKEIFDITGPYRIDYQATKNLIDAATVAGVNHFILLTSLGTNKIGFPAAILNLFWGVLIWKRKAEEALIASGLPYTIVRPGGMERPTDIYKETHNVSLAKEDTLFGGQVSNLQVAELMAFMTKNRDLSCNKVVEVIAETTAPLSPFDELLSKIPSKRVDRSSLKEPQTTPSTVAVATSSVNGKEPPSKTPLLNVRPSSYIMNEDLKSPTPTPPTPIPSTSQIATSTSNVQEAELKPITSQTQDSSKKLTESEKTVTLNNIQNSGYDDLKPPTSPTPAAPSSTKGNSSVVQAVSEPIIAASEANISGSTTMAKETISTPPEVQKTMPLSPYFFYEDLKPPTSPTPTPNSQKLEAVAAAKQENESVPSSGGSATAEKTPADVVKKEVISTEKTSYLSPYPMYEDLKPPSSPIPSPKKC